MNYFIPNPSANPVEIEIVDFDKIENAVSLLSFSYLSINLVVE